MGHVYPSLTEFKQFATGSTFGNDRDATLLTVLESASRTVDGFCERGNGFGPDTSAKTYHVRARRFWRSGLHVLNLEADAIAISSVTVDGTTLDPSTYSLDDPRHLRGPFHPGHEVVVTAMWSYPYQVVTTGATVQDDPLAIDAETITSSDGTKVDIGQTLLVEDEQILVTAIDTDALTVVRGVNGSTAAVHDQDTPIRRFRYDAAAVDATLRVAHRRWKARDAGLTADFGGAVGGAGLPVTSNQDREISILYGTVGHLRFAIVR